ncbi:MAG TPA: hypothetical protein VHF65_01465 [Nitrososphaera sp.]|nr:hypothetical protein [Nitrososphaera sp.]
MENDIFSIGSPSITTLGDNGLVVLTANVNNIGNIVGIEDSMGSGTDT